MRFRLILTLFLGNHLAFGQGLAPTSLPQDWALALTGTYFDSNDPGVESDLGATASAATTASHSYQTTGHHTATLNYTLISEPFNEGVPAGLNDTESGAIQLTFASSNSGTFSYTANYVEQYAGGPLEGGLTGSGTFKLITTTSDDFSSSDINPAIWDGIDTPNTSLAIANQRLNYIVFPPATHDDFALFKFRGATLRYNESWEVRMDVLNMASGTGSAHSGVGMFVNRKENEGNHVFIELGNEVDGIGAGSMRFFSNLSIENSDQPSTDAILDTGMNSGSVRIRFDHETKVLSTFVDRTGSSDGFQWELLGAYGINGSGGQRNGQWEMSPDDEFTIQIYGLSAKQTLGSGVVTMDNFAAVLDSINQTFAEWAESAGLTGLDAAPNAIPFSDGVPNLIKYAFNLNGAAPDLRTLTSSPDITAGLPFTTIGPSSQSPTLAIEFLRRKRNAGVTYQAQFSSDLFSTVSWENATNPEIVTFINDTWERVRIEDHAPPGHASRFARVRIGME